MRGAKAIDEFDRRSMKVVLASEEPSVCSTYRVSSGSSITHVQISAVWAGDLYVMPESWAWCLVMTHESGLGPFFVESSAEDENR